MKRIIVGLLTAVLLLSMAPQTGISAYAEDGSAGPQTSAEAVSSGGSYDGLPQPSQGTTDLYVMVKDRNGAPKAGAQVELYNSRSRLVGTAATGARGYAYFNGSSCGLNTSESYTAKIANAGDYHFEEGTLLAKDIRVRTTSIFNPVNIIGFVLDDDSGITQGLTITTWFMDEKSYSNKEYKYITDNVTFCLTDDLGNKTYMHPDANGLATFSGLSTARTYSVSLAQVPVEYANDKAIEDINNQKDHKHIRVYLNQVYNYAGFVIEKTPHLFTFNVTERGDNSVKISGALFKLTYGSSRVSDKDRTVYLMSGDDGTLYIAEKNGNDYRIADGTAAGINLTEGDYTLEQIRSDSSHNKSRDLHFTVNGRGDLIAIENEIKDYESAKTEFNVTKVWGDKPDSGSDEATIDIQRAVLGSDDYKTVASWTSAGGQTRSTSQTYSMRKYDNDGNRLIYRVKERDMDGWYGITTRDGQGNFIVTNYRGFQDGTSSGNCYWVASSTEAYLIEKQADGSRKVTGKLTIGRNNGSGQYQEFFGDELAYITGNDGSFLYGVSNDGQLIRIKDPVGLIKNNAGSIYNGSNSLINSVRKTSLMGFDHYFYGSPYTHTMEFTKDGRYLMLAAQADHYICMIPRSYVDQQLNSGRSIDMNNFRVQKIDVGRSVINDSHWYDGDIIQLKDGDLLFTAGYRYPKRRAWRYLYRVNYEGRDSNGRDSWGSVTQAGKVPKSMAAGQPQGGTVEGLLDIDGTVYFTATEKANELAYIYPLKEDSSGHFTVDKGGRIELTDPNNGGNFLSGFNSLTGATSGGCSSDVYVGSNVSKVWLGDTPEDRPNEVTAGLYTRTTGKYGKVTDTAFEGSDGRQITRTLNAANDWQASIRADEKLLYKYDNSGHEINYVWKELSTPGEYRSSVDATGHTITNTYIKGKFSFKKVDCSGGRALKGAEFSLTFKKYIDGTDVPEDKQVTYTAESDENGMVTFDNIRPGTYYLKETRTPEGYQEPSGGYTVKVASAEKTAVPDVVGMTRDEAAKALKASGFNPVDKKDGRESGEGTWYVTSVSPGNGEELYSGSDVTMNLSWQEKKIRSIPDEIWDGTEKSDTMKARLENMGFEVYVEKAYSDKYKEGYVFNSDREKGYKVDMDSCSEEARQVTLIVSNGPEPEYKLERIPNYDGPVNDPSIVQLVYKDGNSEKALALSESGVLTYADRIGKASDPKLKTQLWKVSNLENYRGIVRLFNLESCSQPGRYITASGSRANVGRSAATIQYNFRNSGKIIVKSNNGYLSKSANGDGIKTLGDTQADQAAMFYMYGYTGSSGTDITDLDDNDSPFSDLVYQTSKAPAEKNDSSAAAGSSSSNSVKKARAAGSSAETYPVSFNSDNLFITVTPDKGMSWHSCIKCGKTVQYVANKKVPDIVIKKIGADASSVNAGLAGAVFDYYEAALKDTPKAVEIPGMKGADGEKLYGIKQGKDLTTGSDGTIRLSGLTPGRTYYLVETAAPSGYQLPANPVIEFKVRINANGHAVPEGVRIVQVPKGSSKDLEKALTCPNVKYFYWACDPCKPGVLYVKDPKGTRVIVEKVDREDKTKTLEGAEFDLYRSDENGQTVAGIDEKVVKVNKAVLKTGSDGKLELNDLTPDTDYYLIETKAPEGYQKLDRPIHFSVSEDQMVTVSGTDFIDTVYHKCADPEIIVKNTRIYELPKTGGIGTCLFTIAGTALVSLVILMFLEMKRMEQTEGMH